MKYIKKYETTNIIFVYYWKIPTKEPDILVALNILENNYLCNFTITDLLKIYGENLYKLNYIYILKIEEITIDYTHIFDWATEPTINSIKNRFTQNVIIKDKGAIIITKKDIKQYILKQDIEKYNL